MAQASIQANLSPRRTSLMVKAVYPFALQQTIPMPFFSRFVTDELLASIGDYTNEYAHVGLQGLKEKVGQDACIEV